MIPKSTTAEVPERIKQIIQQNDIDALICRAEELADELVNEDLSNTQIRNVYASVKQVAHSGNPYERRRQIKMLLPRLTYAANKDTANKKDENQRGRQDEEGKLKKLTDELIFCIRAMDATDEATYREQFKRFSDFLEAIVAYHYRPSQRSSRKKR